MTLRYLVADVDQAVMRAVATGRYLDALGPIDTLTAELRRLASQQVSDPETARSDRELGSIPPTGTS